MNFETLTTEWKAAGIGVGLWKGDHIGYAILFQNGGVGLFGIEGPSDEWLCHAVDIFEFKPAVMIDEPMLCDVFLNARTQTARLQRIKQFRCGRGETMPTVRHNLESALLHIDDPEWVLTAKQHIVAALALFNAADEWDWEGLMPLSGDLDRPQDGLWRLVSDSV